MREHHGPYVQEWTTKKKGRGDPLKGNQGERASWTLCTGMDYKKKKGGDPLKGNQGEGASQTLWTGTDYKKNLKFKMGSFKREPG